VFHFVYQTGNEDYDSCKLVQVLIVMSLSLSSSAIPLFPIIRCSIYYLSVDVHFDSKVRVR
jgi:hypothetical protein